MADVVTASPDVSCREYEELMDLQATIQRLEAQIKELHSRYSDVCCHRDALLEEVEYWRNPVGKARSFVSMTSSVKLEGTDLVFEINGVRLVIPAQIDVLAEHHRVHLEHTAWLASTQDICSRRVVELLDEVDYWRAKCLTE